MRDVRLLWRTRLFANCKLALSGRLLAGFLLARIPEILIVAMTSVAPIVAFAQNYVFESGLEGGPITASEWKMLPEYCIDTQGFKYGKGQSPNAAKWVALMGETFWHLHHYCLGIVQFNRAQRNSFEPVIRRGFLQSAIDNFQYVTQRMVENFVLAPEIFVYAGRAHLLLKEPKAADEAFARARALKPDYWPAYSWWSTYLANHGQVGTAKALVNAGLEHAPQSRTLQLIKRDLESRSSSRPQASDEAGKH